MRPATLLGVLAIMAAISSSNLYAQQSVVDSINKYGKFDRWSRREVEESSVIGGNTKYLYEFYGDFDTKKTGRTPFSAPEGYLWRTNNVLAVVSGVCKTNNTVFPEKRGRGFCAKIETHIEEVNAIGIINLSVTCQGALMLGTLPEPITSTNDPMDKVFYGIPFTGRPTALKMDIKADVGHEVVRGTGFAKPKKMGYEDYAQIIVILQKRWEDSKGNIHAMRVGTAIHRIEEDIPAWINGYELNIAYGDISKKPYYKDYMGLMSDTENAYRAINSKGKTVIVQEEGWAAPDTEPTHLIIIFLSSCSEAFNGGVGNTLWIDNVQLIME